MAEKDAGNSVPISSVYDCLTVDQETKKLASFTSVRTRSLSQSSQSSMTSSASVLCDEEMSTELPMENPRLLVNGFTAGTKANPSKRFHLRVTKLAVANSLLDLLQQRFESLQQPQTCSHAVH
ncbi:hypothetical protein AVEN_94591-1 [Araneus ventricosus]|uniref:Uncharacterized protein n=1 Tax=Araneus ventricosus TaxID=182803 RepID=A0A4Y2ILP0_ARAVE|nr:hypothetical protein AVEN_94591-1 [Araneus ventricosus]